MKLEKLAMLRHKRQIPTDSFVTLWLDCGISDRDEKLEIAIDATTAVGRIDLRPLVGMSVAIHADVYSERLTKLYERTKEHASFVIVAIKDFGEELGWKWHRLHGEMPL